MIKPNKCFSNLTKIKISGVKLINSSTKSLNNNSIKFIHSKILSRRCFPKIYKVSKAIEENSSILKGHLEKNFAKVSVQNLGSPDSYSKAIDFLEKSIIKLKKKNMEEKGSINQRLILLENEINSLKDEKKINSNKSPSINQIDFEEDDEVTLEEKMTDSNNKLLLVYKALMSENKEFLKTFHMDSYRDSIEKSEKRMETIKASAIRDLFSNNFNFGNQFLTNSFYESIFYFEADGETQDVDEEILTKEQNEIQKEVEELLDKSLEYEMKDIEIDKFKVKHTLGSKPIIRTVLVDTNQPDILLLENDFNLEFDTELEYERLLRASENDDFMSSEILGKSTQDSSDTKINKIEPSEYSTHLIGKGNKPSFIRLDPSIKNI